MSLVAEEMRGSVSVLRPVPLASGVPGSDRLGALHGALSRALADPACTAVVLICCEDGRPLGADMASAHALRAFCELVENAAVPVIAALAGAVQGDMAEVALAAHYRVGTRDVTLGLPGLSLGLPPRAGASQRLPRLCGAEAGLSLLLDGGARTPPPGVLDREGDGEALDIALVLAEETPPVRPTRDRIDRFSDPAGYMRAAARERKRRADDPRPAARRICDCVEAAILLPMEGGLEMEAAAFDDCATGWESRALCALARAEHASWEIPAAAGGTAAPLRRIAIVGGTRRAADLVLCCLEAGYETLLVELDPKGQAAVLERVLEIYEAAMADGRLDASERDLRLSRLTPEAGFEDLAHVDAVWEAALESAALKSELWRAIGLLAAPDALLATAGNVFGLDVLSGAAARPDAVLGLHPVGFSPAATVIELALPGAPAADRVATALSLVRALGRYPVCCADRAGYVVHRLQSALERRIEALLIAGAEAEAVDDALIQWGYRASPCFAMDVEGLDRVLARRRLVAGRGTPTGAAFSLLDALAEMGLTGREEGAGLFSWADGEPRGDDAESRAVMNALADAGGVSPRTFSAAEIQRACLSALANAGAGMIADGTVRGAGDVDLAAVGGIGFPRLRGGPMAAADRAGLIAVERDLAIAPDGTETSPLFAEKIKSGKSFTGQG